MPTHPRFIPVLFRLALLGAASQPALAAPDDEFPNDILIRLTARPYVELGMTRDGVRDMFGAPTATLSADAWIYFDFHGFDSRGASFSAAPGRDTLVIVFSRDRVSRLRLCDSRPVRALLARQSVAEAGQRRSKPTMVARDAVRRPSVFPAPTLLFVHVLRFA